MSRWERWLLAVLVAGFVVSFAVLLRTFYLDTTMLVPTTGGTYVEGSVGELRPLNPWFTVQNDVNRDIVSLVFSGLLRYNPKTRQIESDLATLEVSKDQKVYTLTLKQGVEWHDSTKENPHTVTADDVLFTYQTIQNPAFPNTLLQQNFRGVKVEKADEKTVTFTLPEPYSFFPSNLTLGLLPKSSFADVPVDKLDLASDFSFHPIGAGPYKFRSLVTTDISTEVTLERFDRVIPPSSHLDRVVFRIFPDYSSLLSDMRNLQGVRLVPRNEEGDPIVPRRFTAQNYYLPQYVALFFNLERPQLKDEKLRQGLQFGTDKQTLADGIHESVIVDTPLLELDVGDWRYQFDPDAAQGALLASKWNLPERVRLQKLLEQREANNSGPMTLSSIALFRLDQPLTFSGSYAQIPRGARMNGVPLRDNATASGTWVVSLPFVTGTGALQLGENLVRVTAESKNRIYDSFYLYVARDPAEYARATEERRLAELYVKSRAGQIPVASRITIGNLVLDRGMLRLRTPDDGYSIRQNEKGEPLHVTLLTSPTPAQYPVLAQEIAEQWHKLGVQVEVQVPESQEDFAERLLRRQYDILLFGQSLLDNLDSYPYWHSSGIQRLTGQDKDLRSDAYNLSQYSSFEADTLLETIRSTLDEKERVEALGKLRDVLKRETPAIFLYSPLYTFSYNDRIRGLELGSLSLHSDRFLTLPLWYVKEERIFKEGYSWLSFPRWLVNYPWRHA